MIYGMARDKALPPLLAQCNKHGTPQNALILSAVMASGYALTGNLPLIAETTVIGMLMVFSLDNIALIKLRFKEPDIHRPFKVPFSIKRVPVITVLALIFSLLLMVHELQYKPELATAFFAITVTGLLIYQTEKQY